jgi:hypothetical protein
VVSKIVIRARSLLMRTSWEIVFMVRPDRREAKLIFLHDP